MKALPDPHHRSGNRLERHLKGGREAFIRDEMVYDAVIKVLSNITESASKLEASSHMAYPSIDWNAIKAFRNILVHDYLDDLELDKTWLAIE